MMTYRQRIKRILDEVSGVVRQSNITDWEYQRLREWSNVEALSDKQASIVNRVERKVFPDDYE